MKGRISITLALTLILVPLDLRISYGENTPANSPNCTPAGRILSVENDKIPAGKLLCGDEFIEASRGAKVEVFCFNSGEIWHVISGIRSRVSEGCLSNIASNIAKNDCIPEEGCHSDDPRGPLSNKNTPDIITPYNTDIINPKPPLSWYAVSNANGYTVRVRDITGTGVNWDRRSPNSTSNVMRIEYPADAAPLQPGHQYKLTVEVQTQSNTSPGEEIFTMLSEEEIQEVQEIVAKIDALNLPVEEKVLLDLYSLYTNKNLIAEIIERLETLVRSGSQTPKVYRLLGDIYYRQRLLDIAKMRYEKAVELATNRQDNEELTAAQSKLTQINGELEKLK